MTAKEACLKRELNAKNNLIITMGVEWADDHSHLQKLCRDVGYSEDEIQGDSIGGIPTIMTLADMLYAKIPDAERSM
jgi:hypothetical protein